MAEVALPEDHALSQGERIVDTFVAPSKTFADIVRNASWWLPFLLIVLCSYTLTAAIQSRVGWSQLVENEIRANPRLSDRIASAPAEQVTAQRKGMRYSFSYGFYASPLINLASIAIIALILWPTVNFGFAGSTTYGRVFSVAMYAFLPNAVSALLAALLLFAGRDPASFTTQDMLGSNPGYYIETPGALKVFLSSFDVFAVWSAILLSIGLAIVAGTKRTYGYVAVFGWWVLIIAVKTAIAGMNS